MGVEGKEIRRSGDQEIGRVWVVWFGRDVGVNPRHATKPLLIS